MAEPKSLAPELMLHRAMGATPSHDAVFDALEAAAVAAEGRPQGSAPLAIDIEDFRAAVKVDARAVRDRLDRVVMGEDPERGLDELLEAGALAALFPEVHAMVGLSLIHI